MHIFIDESGDCGMRRENSAPYYAVAAVVVETQELVSACETEIQEIRETLGLPANYEFHFAHIKDRHRRGFLKRIARCEFSYVACYLDKADLEGVHWHEKDFFYEKVLGALVGESYSVLAAAQEAKGKPLNARVFADDNNDPSFFKILRERFRAQKGARKPLVLKVKPGRSKSSDMLQLADMVCGAVVRWYGGERDYLDLVGLGHGKMKKLFEKKEGDL